MAELSEQTLAEMAEGARQTRVNSGGDLPPGYLDEIIRTQQRMAQLQLWERNNRIRIEYATRYRTNEKGIEPQRATIIYVRLPDGTEAPFQDLHAQEVGSWPSEELLARVALCLMANEGKPYDPAS